MFKKNYLKEYYLEKAKQGSTVNIDVPEIESESIRITAGLDKRDDFYKIDDFITDGDDEYMKIASGDMEEEVTGMVMPTSLKVRKDIGSDGEVLEMINHGDEVSIKRAFNGWYQVETKNGVLGWCMCCHIDTNIGGYDRQDKAKARNKYIERTLEKTKNGLLGPDDEPTKLRGSFFSKLFGK